MRRSSVSQPPRLRSATGVRLPFSAITSTCTTSSGRSRTAQRSAFITKAGWRRLELKADERPKIDPDFEEVTEGEEVTTKEKLKSKWARMEAMVGTEKRLGLIAEDLVRHFEQRLEAMDGKAMIVCMSRRIASICTTPSQTPA